MDCIAGGLTLWNTDRDALVEARVLEAHIRELTGAEYVELRWDQKQVAVLGVARKGVERVAARVLQHQVRVVVLSPEQVST